jgi:hypothetical protein
MQTFAQFAPFASFAILISTSPSFLRFVMEQTKSGPVPNLLSVAKGNV